MRGVHRSKYNESICINCNRKFLKRKHPNVGTYAVGVRGFNCITCSRKCSRIYNIGVRK